jgi:hypothetical protein
VRPERKVVRDCLLFDGDVSKPHLLCRSSSSLFNSQTEIDRARKDFKEAGGEAEEGSQSEKVHTIERDRIGILSIR